MMLCTTSHTIPCTLCDHAEGKKIRLKSCKLGEQNKNGEENKTGRAPSEKNREQRECHSMETKRRASLKKKSLSNGSRLVAKKTHWIGCEGCHWSASGNGFWSSLCIRITWGAVRHADAWQLPPRSRCNWSGVAPGHWHYFSVAKVTSMCRNSWETVL